MLPVVKQASARCLKGYVHWYNVAVPRRSGGIGRRAGLKIRWCESTVSVRARPPVLVKFLQKPHFSVQMEESPRRPLRGLWQQCGSNRLREGLFHCGRSRIAHVRQHMRVGIEGDGYGRMSKHLGDDLRVHVAGE